MPGTPSYVFGPFTVDAARRLLLRENRPLPMTARAFDLLVALLARAGQTVEKQELLEAVWPDTVVEEANLSQQIFTIRKLLGQTDDEPYIATVPRRGYRFVAAVTRTGHAAAAASPVTPAPPYAKSLRLAIPLEPSAPLAVGPSASLAVSPDGSVVAYILVDGATTRLFLRRLDRFEPTAVPGTEGAAHPFFSPDGGWLGFQSGRRLWKVPVDGGPPLALAELADLRGATWTAGGDIVYAPGPTSGLWRVSSSGGQASPFTALDFDGGERTHRWPHAMPDGRGIIFTIGHAGATSFDEATLAVADIGDTAHRLVLQHATDGRCLADGHLVWARGATLLAAPFDLESRRVDGAARAVMGGVAMSATGVAHFDCSSTGVLVHVPGEAQTLGRSLVTVNRRGEELARCARGESLEEPRVAPDGRSAIVSLRSRSSDLWLYDFARRALGRLTFEGENFAGIWGPGPSTVTFSSSRGGPSDLYCLWRDRSAPPELLVASEFDKVPGSWSPDANALVFTEYHPETGADVWIFERAAERVRPFVRTRFNEYAPVFSPDGRYIAYATDESGRAEIVVVAYPEATGKRQLSTEGGAEPVWSPDGTELFYRSGDRLMRVDMRRGPDEASIPTTLFEGRFVPGTVTIANYDVTGGGTEFLMVVADVSPPPTALYVSVGWSAGMPSAAM